VIDLTPMEFNVIVELDPTEETTSGGIILPGQRVERNRLEETEGTLIAASPLAFNFEEGAPRAEIGDRVYFAKYAGILVEREGRWVRIVKDKDIVAGVRSKCAMAKAA
jgi:chaperonin GroES